MEISILSIHLILFLAILGCFFGILGFILGIWALARVWAAENSTREVKIVTPEEHISLREQLTPFQEGYTPSRPLTEQKLSEEEIRDVLYPSEEEHSDDSELINW